MKSTLLILLALVSFNSFCTMPSAQSSIQTQEQTPIELSTGGKIALGIMTTLYTGLGIGLSFFGPKVAWFKHYALRDQGWDYFRTSNNHNHSVGAPSQHLAEFMESHQDVSVVAQGSILKKKYIDTRYIGLAMLGVGIALAGAVIVNTIRNKKQKNLKTQPTAETDKGQQTP